MRYSCVLLDVGETLLGPADSFGAVYSGVLGPMGLDFPADRWETALRTVWRDMDTEIPSGTDRYAHFDGGENGYWLRFAKRTMELAAGRPVPESFAADALQPLRDAFLQPGAWRVYPEVRPALEEIETSGARMAVVSNWDSLLPEVLRLVDLEKYFETLVVSHLEGVEKPDPAIFRLALKRLGADPTEAVHVGDRPDLDMEGARTAGVDGVLVDRRGRYNCYDCTVRDLSGLPAIVLRGRH